MKAAKMVTCKYIGKAANKIGHPQIKLKTRKYIQIPANKTKIPPINTAESLRIPVRIPVTACLKSFSANTSPDFQKISING
ncbi:hypothetical protein [Bacillus infantis]|uniref:Uncharacterized protein n=1 Tax=Bacillus infantis TaxID=324767 RepID=A0A5D4RFH2_9BACI|nr:hypothetical protein [Bacillus infantis]TYS50223.1 hypothetical protein FZD51_06645 [Bacillus infantis]